MRSECRKCGRTFTGMTAFDRHWSKVPMKAGQACREPEDVGLVANAKGVWGLPGASPMGWIVAGREYEADWAKLRERANDLVLGSADSIVAALPWNAEDPS